MAADSVQEAAWRALKMSFAEDYSLTDESPR